jgi:hypothetical protein
MSQIRSVAVDLSDVIFNVYIFVVAGVVLSAAAAVATSTEVLCNFCAISPSISWVAIEAEAETNIKA